MSGNNSTTYFSLGANAGNSTAAVRVNSSTALGVPSGTINVAGGQGNQTSQRIELTGSGLSISNSIPGGLGRNLPAAVIVNLGTGNTWAGRLTRSTGDARRLIQGGGLRVNDAPVPDARATVSLRDVSEGGVLKLSLGKKQHILVRPI